MLYEPKHVALCMDEAERKIALEFSEGYKEFLNVAKTEPAASATFTAYAADSRSVLATFKNSL